MSPTNITPEDQLSSALEAVRNLFLPELREILQGGWTAALAANSELNIRPMSERSAPFYRHLLPLLKDLASLFAGAYRRYFKLALAHPLRTGRDPHEWSLQQLNAAIGATLEWLRDWYILACDGSNQYVQPVASVPVQPGQMVTIPIPLSPAETALPESWRAPAWLFSVGPPAGIGPLKTKHVPSRDSEEKLGAAHTRLLLKGARRVFLRKLGAEFEIVRNEEIASAGTLPTSTESVREVRGPSKTPKHWLKGTEGLGRGADLSKYMDNLTERQRLAFSLKYEHGLGPTEIASRMGIDRKTLQEHLDAANRKVGADRSFEKRRITRLRNSSDE